MSEKAKSKRLKTILTVVTFFALVGTAYALRSQIGDTIENLKNANPLPILLLIPLALCNHFAQAKLYQGVFRLLGNRFRTRSMMRLSLEMNFVNNIVPSGGISGFSYLSIRMRGEGVNAGKATLVQMMRFGLLFISFQILLGLGLLFLAISGEANDLVILAAGSISTFLFLTTGFMGYIIGSKDRIDRFFITLTRFINWLIHKVRPKHPETINIKRVRSAFHELHENFQLLRGDIRKLKGPLAFATLANMCEVAAIFSVFIAFGQLVNPGAIIIAYAVANFAGLVSVLPGGVGIYEGLMTGVFATAGVKPALSLPVVLAFRVVSMAIQLPVGYFFYQKSLHYIPPEEG